MENEYIKGGGNMIGFEGTPFSMVKKFVLFLMTQVLKNTEILV